jgi:hypothetical protein
MLLSAIRALNRALFTYQCLLYCFALADRAEKGKNAPFGGQVAACIAGLKGLLLKILGQNGCFFV